MLFLHTLMLVTSCGAFNNVSPFPIFNNNIAQTQRISLFGIKSPSGNSQSITPLFTSLNIQDAEIEEEEDDDDDDDEDDERPEFPGSRQPREAKDKAILKELAFPPRAVSIVTTTRDTPIRYLLPLTSTSSTNTPFVMVDVPPYSSELHTQLLSHTNQQHPMVLLITNQNSIHYDETPGVYTSRRSDLKLWIQAFPKMHVVMHRIDMWRDLTNSISFPKYPDTKNKQSQMIADGKDGEDMVTLPLVTQVLDGYGPWAWDIEQNSFVESGRPLTVLEWDDDKVAEFFQAGMESDENETEETDVQEQIRSHQEGKSLLAIYTPGHTMGSMSYILPDVQTCVSGFTIPPPDSTRTLDYKGYISTNRATVERQVNSIRELKDLYVDRFQYVLPSRGNPISLNDDVVSLEDEEEYDEDEDVIDMDNISDEKDDEQKIMERKGRLEEIVSRFEKIGNLYESLGITQPK